LETDTWRWALRQDRRRNAALRAAVSSRRALPSPAPRSGASQTPTWCCVAVASRGPCIARGAQARVSTEIL